MPKKNDTLPLIFALISTVLVVGVGFWWLKKTNSLNISNDIDVNNTSLPGSTSSKNSQVNYNSGLPSAKTTFSPPNIVPQGTAITINGSTSLVQTNQVLKKSFQRQFPGTAVITNAQGSETGIEMLQTGDVDLAAISRPLNDQEQAQGLVAVPIVKDTIAVFVGVNNPFRTGLSGQQVVDIFQGNLTNWSQLGGKNQTIRVLNRPQISGTRQVFKTQVLPKANFGRNSNFITMERDATTPIIRALGSDGIGYATYAQVANQQTVRIVAINGLTPEAQNYPYQRVLYYAYQEPANLEVQAFLGFALSSQGQRAISGLAQ